MITTNLAFRGTTSYCEFVDSWVRWFQLISFDLISLLRGDYQSREIQQISDYIKWYNMLNERLINRLSQRIGLSVAKPVWR